MNIAMQNECLIVFTSVLSNYESVCAVCVGRKCGLERPYPRISMSLRFSPAAPYVGPSKNASNDPGARQASTLAAHTF